FLEKQKTSLAQADVGFQSDVHLLGGLLFEIVTGKPPHLLDETASPYDIIRDAASNQIIDYSAYADDELLQIALRALRTGDGDPILNVKDFLAALEAYENRRLSIELRMSAQELLQQAKTSGDYDEYQRARFGFEESLKKWEDNSAAMVGLRAAKLNCAEQAFTDQNFELGLGMLDGELSTEEKSLFQRLENGKNRRDRRAKLVGWLAVGLASSILIGFALNSYFFQANMTLMAARDSAVIEKDAAEKAKVAAELERVEIQFQKREIEIEKQRVESEVGSIQGQLLENQKEIEEFPLRLNSEQKKYQARLNAEKERNELELRELQAKSDAQVQQQKQRLESQLQLEQNKFDAGLVEAKRQFEEQEKELIQQKAALKQQVTQLQESSVFLRYKSRISSVFEKLNSGDYRGARLLLNEFVNRQKIEVQRLNLLAHPEIEAIYPETEIVAFNHSIDGRQNVLVFSDRIEVRSSESGQPILAKVAVQNASAAAISSTAKRLAVAKAAVSRLLPGVVEVYDFAEPGDPKLIKRLDAQSRKISCLQFDATGKQLLSVGTPSKIRKSSLRNEKELMVWDEKFQPVETKMVAANGSLPRFDQAQFSSNGNRILVYFSEGISSAKRLHLFEKQGSGFNYLTESPFAGANVGTFEDDAGDNVIACVRSNQLGNYSLVRWKLNGIQDSNFGPQFIRSESGGSSSVQTIGRLTDKALFLFQSNRWLLSGGLDKVTTLWDLNSNVGVTFQGNSKAVRFGALIGGKTIKDCTIISGSTGYNSELIRNELSQFQNEYLPKKISPTNLVGRPSPVCIHTSSLADRVTVGNDIGEVGIQWPVGRMSWMVSAWKKHYLTRQFLFAQSNDDSFLRYDRSSGHLLEKVNFLKKKQARIFRIQFSENGKSALVIYDNQVEGCEIWDLERGKRIRTLNFAKEDLFGTGSGKGLPLLSLSPNGNWIVGGKVNIYAWSVINGQRVQLSRNGIRGPRTGALNIVHLDEDLVLACWKNRIEMFDLGQQKMTGSFRVNGVSIGRSESSVFKAKIIGNQILIAAPPSSGQGGLVVVALRRGQQVAAFPNAIDICFDERNENQLVFIDRVEDSRELKRFSLKNKQTILIGADADFSKYFGDRFERIEKVFANSEGVLTLQITSQGT
ncbi:MAG: hypothetical protein AAF939_21890, partial [Planctomycetota bacterium]